MSFFGNGYLNRSTQELGPVRRSAPLAWGALAGVLVGAAGLMFSHLLWALLSLVGIVLALQVLRLLGKGREWPRTAAIIAIVLGVLTMLLAFAMLLGIAMST